MRYLPHTAQEVECMLQTVGVDRIDRLFEGIPDHLRLKRPLDLPPAKDEEALVRRLRALAAKNEGSADRQALFLGAGCHAHHIPAAVNQLLLRGEFFTAYTPYQPETSQGTLQAIFEYQSMLAELMGCEVVNASMYDGATATAEAALMALRVQKKRSRILLARSLHPELRQVCGTFMSELPTPPEEVNFGAQGTVDLAALSAALDAQVAAVVVQQPNFLGCLEDLPQLVKMVHDAGALLVVAVLEPVSLGLLEAPGKLGADIVTGEGMSLGTGMNFGGPGLGMFGSKSQYLWQMPGRLVGQTRDQQGQRGFVLTLSTREQHIRRARATSNICSNEGLCALAAAIHLSLIGKEGFSRLARTNAANARFALAALEQTGQVKRIYPAPFFNEFAIRLSKDPQAILERLLEKGILGGVPLQRFYPDHPELARSLLVCVTEQNQPEEVARYQEVLKST